VSNSSNPDRPYCQTYNYPMGVAGYGCASTAPHGAVTVLSTYDSKANAAYCSTTYGGKVCACQQTQVWSVWTSSCSRYGTTTKPYGAASTSGNYGTTSSKGHHLNLTQKLMIAFACVVLSPIILALAILAAGLAICVAGAAIGAAAVLIGGVFWLLYEFAMLLFRRCSSHSSQGRGGSAAEPTGPQDPISRFLAQFFGRRLPVERDPGVMVQILDKNRDRKVSRLGRELAKEVYSPGSNPPLPSKAWARLHAAATGPPQPKTCCICEEDLLNYRFPDRDVSDDCHGHARTACLECVAREIQRTLEVRSWSEAQCILCPGRLNYDQISEFAFKEVFEK
jgi:hypothetical protein